MSFGGSELYALLNVSSITSLLTNSSYLYRARVIPDGVPSNAKTINFYRSTPVDSRVHYMQTTWSINCRAATEGEALTIAEAVFDLLAAGANSDRYFMPVMLSPIPPLDDTDTFNVPVEVDSRGKTF